jgi:F420-dependent oxidoreductase-like protein
MIRAGLQIPNFTYPGVAPDELFGRIAGIATTAERSGFDTIMVMDHFYQLPLLGPPDHEMFESYTLLGALAARTESAQLGTLVTGVTYRNPAILAKTVTAVDVISRGRAFLGIGAAWFEFEHQGLGVDFPPTGQRFEMLEEALQICRAMFRGERPTFEGKHYRTREAINVPAPIREGGPPVMIGGQGEKKTLRLMAQYADMANFTASIDELPRKVEVLAQHCDDLGRDPATINKTPLLSVAIGETQAEADELRDGFLTSRGMPRWADLDDATRAMVGGRIICGDADTVSEQIQNVLAIGLDGVCVNMPTNGWDLDAVAHAGQVVRAAVGSSALPG